MSATVSQMGTSTNMDYAGGAGDEGGPDRRGEGSWDDGPYDEREGDDNEDIHDGKDSGKKVWGKEVVKCIVIINSPEGAKICGRTLQRREMRRHLDRQHGTPQRWDCTHEGCLNNDGKGFSTKSHLRGHVESLHVQKPRGIQFPCAICHKTFGRKSSADRHMRDDHKIEPAGAASNRAKKTNAGPSGSKSRSRSSLTAKGAALQAPSHRPSTSKSKQPPVASSSAAMYLTGQSENQDGARGMTLSQRQDDTFNGSSSCGPLLYEHETSDFRRGYQQAISNYNLNMTSRSSAPPASFSPRLPPHDIDLSFMRRRSEPLEPLGLRLESIDHVEPGISSLSSAAWRLSLPRQPDGDLQLESSVDVLSNMYPSSIHSMMQTGGMPVPASSSHPQPLFFGHGNLPFHPSTFSFPNHSGYSGNESSDSEVNRALVPNPLADSSGGSTPDDTMAEWIRDL